MRPPANLRSKGIPMNRAACRYFSARKKDFAMVEVN
jgi:hypothetical protein